MTFLYLLTSLLNCVPCVLKPCSHTDVLCVLMRSRANVPYTRTCSLANVPCALVCSLSNVPCVLTYSRGNVSFVLACQGALCPYVLTCKVASRALALTGQRASSAYLTCKHVLRVLECIDKWTWLANSRSNVLTCLESFASYGLRDHMIIGKHVFPPQ